MRIGRRGAGLHAGQHGIGHVKAFDLAAEGGQGLADCGDGIIGQAGGQIGRRHAGAIGRDRRSPRAGRCPAGDEIAHQLRRRRIGAAARDKGRAFPMPLQRDAGQRVAGIICSGVMPTTMPALALRSLREYWLMPLVTTRPGSDGRRHHRAAGAHAEAVDAAAIAGVMHQPVFRRAQSAGWSGRSAPCRSGSADARCESRWKKAWPRSPRRGHAASRKCRGRCGPPPARHGRLAISSPLSSLTPRSAPSRRSSNRSVTLL